MSTHARTMVSLSDVSSYLPKNTVSADYFGQDAKSDDLASNVMFKAPAFRHHVAPDESPPDMIEQAIGPLLERQGSDMLGEIDVLITHTQLPDLGIVGSGGEIAHRLGIVPEWLIDLHNGGCASFVYMMKIARQILQSTDARSALIATTQNSAGQIFTQEQVRALPQAAIPGDGAGVGLLTKSGDSPILDIECRHAPRYAGQMTVLADPPASTGRRAPGKCTLALQSRRSRRCLLAETNSFRRLRPKCANGSESRPTNSTCW